MTVRGAIDSPTDGSTVAAGSLKISGWSLAGSSPSRGVVVMLDGEVVGGARTGAQRSEVAAELGIPEAEKAGFSCAVDLDIAPDSMPSGTVTIDVAALLDDGTLSPVFARSTVWLSRDAAPLSEATVEEFPAPTVLEGSIDTPGPDSRVPAGLVKVEGWAAFGRKPVLEVFVSAGDRGVVRATPQVRSDVAEHFGAPTMKECGFQAEVDLRHLIGRPQERVSIDVAVIVDEAHLGDLTGPAITTLDSVEVLVDGSLSRPKGGLSSEQPSDGHAFLDEALAHAELGLPVPKGMRFGGTKRIVSRLGWPFLHRQLAFNRATVNELTLQLSRAREDRVRVYAQLENMGRAFERLVGDLRAELAQQLAEVHIAHRHQFDLVQRQTFQRHHEDLGGLRSELTEMAFELDGLRKQVRGLGELESHGHGNFSDYPEALEGTYAEFEDTFRGSFELIKDRATEYLADVLAVELPGPVLDVGCGRGEWLEVLKEAGVEAYGVDLEEEFVMRCVNRGLDARRADAFRHLADIPEHSLAAVTAFQVVEHLPTDMTAELVDLSARALRPGGLLILETQNPENLVVGSSTFYIDPGHIRPLNPKFLEFLVAARGFVDVEVRFKHPDPALQPPDENAPWAADLLPMLQAVNERFYGGRDFAIVARRG
jgi:SAM-dependent methyltransferase